MQGQEERRERPIIFSSLVDEWCEAISGAVVKEGNGKSADRQKDGPSVTRTRNSSPGTPREVGDANGQKVALWKDQYYNNNNNKSNNQLLLGTVHTSTWY